jgi:undecaprenyl-diphosphatase
MLFDYPIRLDLGVSHALQFYHPAWLVGLAEGVSFLGSPLFVVILALVLLTICYIKRWRIEMVRIFLVLSGNLLTLILKPFFGRDRPQPGFVFKLFNEASFSFPSGHSLCAMLIGGYFWLLSANWPTKQKRAIRLLAVIFVLSIGWSRIYLGVHWLTDVVAGYIFSFIWLAAVAVIWPRIKRAISKKT